MLGIGGMGEVYRAHDTTLNRDVAVKVLPRAFAAIPDRVSRLRREAQLLASLNHPHIAAIYAVEDPIKDSRLIMELVEGPTLAERIARDRFRSRRLGDCEADRRRSRSRARTGHRSSGLEAGECQIHPDGQVKFWTSGSGKR